MAVSTAIQALAADVQALRAAVGEARDEERGNTVEVELWDAVEGLTSPSERNGATRGGPGGPALAG